MTSKRIDALRGRLAASLALGIATIGFVGCSDNVSGDLEAVAFGDLSNPPASRADGYREIGAQCDGTASASAELRRRPFLQQLTTDSARLLWTTVGEEPASVVVTAEDGT